VEPLFQNLIDTCAKLKELGLTEVNGKIIFIDNQEGKR